MTAFTVLLVALAAVVPTNRLFFLGASTLSLLVAGEEAGQGLAAGAAVAAGLLALFLLPPGPWTWSFLGFFAPYAVVKRGAERLPFLWSWLAKLAFFQGVAFSGFFLLGVPTPRFPRWALAVAGSLCFLVYDAALTCFLGYYRRRFAPGRIR